MKLKIRFVSFEQGFHDAFDGKDCRFVTAQYVAGYMKGREAALKAGKPIYKYSGDRMPKVETKLVLRNVVGRFDLDFFDGRNVTDVIESLMQLVNEHLKADSSKLRFDVYRNFSSYENDSLEITLEREETDDELAARLELNAKRREADRKLKAAQKRDREAAQKRDREAAERETYEKLKKKFEGK